MSRFVEWPPRRRRPRFPLVLLLIIVAALLLGSRTALTYYIDALWFGSLGYAEVFWKTLRLQSAVFTIFAAATFVILYSAFLAMKRAYLQHMPGGHSIYVGNQELKLPVDSILRYLGA